MSFKEERIGILGGTFDPVHNGHIRLAKEAIAAGDLDLVLFLVSKRPPHKNVCAADGERYEMVELALRGEDKLRACPVEMRREGKSYTSDSLAELREEYPAAKLFYIIGSDVLSTLPYWHEQEKVFSLVEFICFRRSGGMPSCGGEAQCFSEEQKSRIHVYDACIPDISSQKIRDCLRWHIPCPDISPAVEKYIREKELYA